MFSEKNKQDINSFLSSLSTTTTNDNILISKNKAKTLEDLKEDVEVLEIYLAREDKALADEYSLMSRFDNIRAVAIHCKFLNVNRHKLNYKRTLINNL